MHSRTKCLGFFLLGSEGFLITTDFLSTEAGIVFSKRVVAGSPRLPFFFVCRFFGGGGTLSVLMLSLAGAFERRLFAFLSRMPPPFFCGRVRVFFGGP
jgi:hypothetical protein